MKILLAKTAGFCMGVRRAMEMAVSATRSCEGPIHSIGPLIHNDQVIDVLESHGVCCRDDPPETGTVILRAHGVPPNEKQRFIDDALRVVDATCPHVLTSQKRIAKDSENGAATVLVGDPNHPEMIGLAGHATGPLFCISTLDEAAALSPPSPFIVIAQTTFKHALYRDICNMLQQKHPDCKIYDSICAATEERQLEAQELAQRAEALVVVGGRHSSNTKRLAEIGRECGRPTFHVETAAELDADAFSQIRVVGVTAGASTPSWITQSVIDRLDGFGQATPFERTWRALGFLARSRVLTSIGAASLTYSMATLMKATPLPSYAYLLCSFFVFVAYTVNRRTALLPATNSIAPVDQFFLQYRQPLGTLTGASILGIIVCAYLLGFHVLILIGCISLISCIYAIPLLPVSKRYRCLKDLPASKDLLTATAWAIVLIGVIYFASEGGQSHQELFGCGVVVFLIIFSQTVLLDLRDIESDQLIGVETLPVLIGRSQAIRLIYVSLGLAFISLILFYFITSGGVDPVYSLVLTLIPCLGLVALFLLSRLHFRNDVGCQLIMDAQLLIAGGIAFCWQIL